MVVKCRAGRAAAIRGRAQGAERAFPSAQLLLA